MPKKQFFIPKKIITAGIAFLFLVLVIVTFFGNKGLFEIYQLQKNKTALAQEAGRLILKRDKLARGIRELENNPYAVELKARDKLWLADPDEIVIVKD